MSYLIGRANKGAANQFASQTRFIPASSATADRFPVAGTSYTDGCAPSPKCGPHWSCGNCGAGFPPASFPFRKIRCVPLEYPKNFPPMKKNHAKPCRTYDEC